MQARHYEKHIFEIICIGISDDTHRSNRIFMRSVRNIILYDTNTNNLNNNKVYGNSKEDSLLTKKHVAAKQRAKMATMMIVTLQTGGFGFLTIT